VGAQCTLLLDAGRLGIPLQHDQAAQRVAELARHFLPDRLSLEITETNPAIRRRLGEKNPPAIIRQLDVIEMRPARRVHTGRGAQIYLMMILEPLWSHVAPPVEIRRLPVLQRPQQTLVGRQFDVIWNAFVELHMTPVSQSSVVSRQS
jgi:hypothetical protein